MKKSTKLRIRQVKWLNSKNLLLKIVISLILIYGLFYVIQTVYKSAFFQKSERINIVINDESPSFFSVGLSDNVNYFIPFYPDLEVEIPGGYGSYRLGALDKLSELEKNPELIRKTYSLMTSSMVDYYFYPNLQLNKKNTATEVDQVFFGHTIKDIKIPSFSLIFFAKSNANLLDRIYLYWLFLGKNGNQFKNISNLPVNDQGGKSIFINQDFFKILQGYFYKRSYRKEMKDVQILYTKSYQTAEIIGQILEGEGISIADISKYKSVQKKCQVVEDSHVYSITAKSIANYFNCDLTSGNTNAYDIILKLNDEEKYWGVE